MAFVSGFTATGASAAIPIVTSTSFSEVSEASATLQASVDPDSTKVKDVHFEYLPLSSYQADGESFADAFTTPAQELQTQVGVKGDLAGPGSATVTNLTAPSGGVLLVGQQISGEGIAAGTTIVRLGPGALELAKPPTETKAGVALTARGAPIAGSGDLEAKSALVKNLSTTSGAFGKGQTISGAGIPPETVIEAVLSATSLELSKPATATAASVSLSAAVGQPISAQIAGLTPGTAYVFRAVATNAKPEEAQGPPTTFYTLAPPPTYQSCPNEIFRTGEFSAPGQPSALLPDCRSYERATPPDKDGDDAVGTGYYVRAASAGAAVTYGTTFGMPGGEGGQSLPFFQASRGPGEAGWSSRGLLPPAATGQIAHFMIGWLPDLSATFASATRLGVPQTKALLELHQDGSPPTQIAPYADLGTEDLNSQEYVYAGASADASEVAFEATAQLPPTEGEPPLPGSAPDHAHNVYAWDAATGRLSLASVLNTEAQTKAALAKGAYAGPYDWAEKTLIRRPTNYYLAEEHAVAEDGSLFFTSVSSGQLYERINPTEPQSPVTHAGEPEEECTNPALACTLHISGSEKTNGSGKGGADGAGPQPAAFMAASADGKTAFFTSSEKLTDEANTGPEQPEAAIGRADIEAADPQSTLEEDLLPTHALGVAVDPAGEYLYWADPSKGTIGRAKLNQATGKPEQEEPSFIEPEDTEVEIIPEGENPELLTAPTRPRYVAVDGHYLYWTNTGPLAAHAIASPYSTGAGEAIPTAGTIGRADIDPTQCAPEPAPCEVEAEFITGASNPQGIAVNESHIYWANASSRGLSSSRSIARAAIGGGGVEEHFAKPFASGRPYGLALDSNYVYFADEEEAHHDSYLARVPLEGGPEEVNFIGEELGIGGIALDGSYLYWASQGEGEIGRIPIAGFDESCLASLACDPEFLTPHGSPVGLTIDGHHLFYSVNGENPRNPGNDLYRYRAGAQPPLEDLTPDPQGNGAEVQGLVGASADGSYIYFVANGDLDGPGPAEPGDCRSAGAGVSILEITGTCNLYLWHGGEVTFIASLTSRQGVGKVAVEGSDWVPSPRLAGQAETPKTALVSPDGRTLLLVSSQQLTSYDNHGAPEVYRYRVGPGFACLSCAPSGEAPTTGGTQLQSFNLYKSFKPGATSGAAVSQRYLADEGNRAFFETAEPLVVGDTNGVADVYEWEAPGTGSCEAGGPAYSPLNQGCLYLISTGKGSEPAVFADASESGDDVYFFTRAHLVGADTDSLLDVYDARVGGGLDAQNPPPEPPCEAEGCKPGPTEPPAFTAPPQFEGPPNPKPKRPVHPTQPCRRAKAKRKGSCHQGGHHHHRHHHGSRTPRASIGGGK